MEKKYLFAIFLVSCIIIISMLFTHQSITKDTSWIDDVENFINKKNWDSEIKYEPMSDWSFFLVENGTEQFFALEGQNEFISFVNNLLNKVNDQIEDSLDPSVLGELKTNERMLKVVHRFSTKSDFWKTPNNFGAQVDYDLLYFVLKDDSGKGLEGTIIVREPNAEQTDYVYSVWQIT
ncbi:MAG: hypothetical protein IAX21_08705 [Candidatus Bathyarchaeota archaeon]|nr:hypothetical protein [Candidatus Bathyarchaeum tardum]WGM89042.1 MAG: hypothetical protein NUK63_09015 [Candidatus Bathyarchaeum tardum]WNZ28720.1 MAG: hypothetical protein IAX21_08705 [Candidatus Bathyarchaeota archaeon]